jgi:hypothetical protein
MRRIGARFRAMHIARQCVGIGYLSSACEPSAGPLVDSETTYLLKP